MEQNRVGLLAACAFALAMIACGIALAGYQIKEKVCKLTCEGWQLQEKDGLLGLAQIDSGKWFASAPTITDSKNRYISGDPEGKSPTLHLVEKKNPHINWAFDFSKQWKPVLGEMSGGSRYLQGNSGFRFKMKLSEGPFKDWYVAVDPISPEEKSYPTKVATWRPLKLMQDAKDAAELEYVDTFYDEGHK